MKQHLLIALCLLIVSGSASACIWDRDTLAMERARFPEVNELIVGYFPRHSSPYYQWRLDQIKAIPIDQRTAADFDDLGASYDKLGQHDQAIQTMLDKIERFPDEGVYETHANLGTFYIHNGDLEQGVQYIGSAIEINPEAHFGREVYQRLLVEYVIQQRAAGNTLPLHQDAVHPFNGFREGFAAFVIDVKGLREAQHEEKQKEIQRAIKGILGMMRFGNYDSPVLLEALGDLLSTQFEGDSGVQRLAARAYLKASYEVDDNAASTNYRMKAEAALDMQELTELSDIEADLQDEIAEGDAYFAKIEADEKSWIAAGKDVDDMFIRTYYEDAPEYSQSLLGSARDKYSSYAMETKIQIFLVVFGSICFVSLIIVVIVIRRMRVKRGDIAAKLQQV